MTGDLVEQTGSLPRHRPAKRRSLGSIAKFSRAFSIGAAVLGVTALVNHTLARRAERTSRPEGKFVTIDGVRLHYIERGTGPVVILLHGNGTMARDFVLSGVFDLLAEDHRVIAFDRPGFGFSERPRSRIWSADAQAELLEKAVTNLNVRGAVVVGHSWGTLVAIALALRNQSNAAALVLLSGYYFPTFRKDVALVSWPALPILGDVLRYTLSPLLGRAMAPMVHRKMFAPAPVSSHFAREFPLELAVRPSQIRASAAEAALMVPAAATLEQHYTKLSMPIAIMAGNGDRIVNFDRHAARLHAELHQSTLTEIPSGGHMIHHTVPELVAAITREIACTARARDGLAEQSRPPV